MIPDFFSRWPAIRFPTHSRRDNPVRLTMRDYLAAVTSRLPIAASKDAAPAWALCNSTGDGSGAPTGMIQIDLDHVADVPAMRSALAEYGGFLAVVRSFSGHGVVAYGYVGPRLAADPAAVQAVIYAPLRGYLRTRGFDDDAYEIDPSCARPCQLRYESRDQDAWVSPAPARLYADPEDADWLSWHPVASLAEALCPSLGLCPMSTAAALTCIGMSADLRSRMVDDVSAQAYPARAFCIVVGDPGCGKTTILGAVQDVARAMHVTVSDPKNAPTLREHIMSCGCDDIIDPPEPGQRVGRTRRVERADGRADPLVVCMDEAGQRMRTRSQDESCGSFPAILRQCNGSPVTLEGTVKQEHKGSYRVPAHVSVLMGTTLPQWAEYAAAVRADNGEARRITEFLQPSAEADIFAAAPVAVDVAAVVAVLSRLRDAGRAWADADARFAPAPDTRGAVRSAVAWLCSRGLDSPSAQSLVMCVSTLCAGFRAGTCGARPEIGFSDLAAAVRILSHVLNARAAIVAEAERRAATGYRPDGEVWAEILGWIEKNPRRDKILDKVNRRGTQHRRIYAEAIARKSLVSYRGADGKYRLRLADAEELERDAERADAMRSPTPPQGSPRGTATPYADCPRAERDERVLAYATRYRSDHPVVEGNRNNALAGLAYALQRNGMWDDAAQDYVRAACEHAGLHDAEIRKIMRARKIEKA